MPEDTTRSPIFWLCLKILQGPLFSDYATSPAFAHLFLFLFFFSLDLCSPIFWLCLKIPCYLYSFFTITLYVPRLCHKTHFYGKKTICPPNQRTYIIKYKHFFSDILKIRNKKLFKLFFKKNLNFDEKKIWKFLVQILFNSCLSFWREKNLKISCSKILQLIAKNQCLEFWRGKN